MISEVKEENNLPHELLDTKYYNQKYSVPIYQTTIEQSTFFNEEQGMSRGIIVAITQSDFNRFTMGEHIQLEKGEYVIAKSENRIGNRMSKMTTPEYLPWNQDKLKFKSAIEVKEPISYIAAADLFLVVNDQNVSPEMRHGEKIFFNFKNYKEQSQEYQKLIESKQIYYHADTRYNTHITNNKSKMLISFIALYLGIIFLISSVTLLAIQQLVLIQESKSRYELLEKIGVDKKSLNRSNFQQICINFLTPLVFGTISAIVGMYALNRTINIYSTIQVDLYTNMLYTGSGVLSLYIVYMILTYLGSKNILK